MRGGLAPEVRSSPFLTDKEQTMAHTVAGRGDVRAQRRFAGVFTALPTVGTRASGRRHPLVATAMVLPVALLLAVVFGGVEAVVTQASSVVGMLGR